MKTADPVPLPRRPPRRGMLARRIRDLVTDGAFSYASHAFDSVDGPDVDLADALDILTTGTIVGEIVPGKDAGEWTCRMVGKIDKSSRRLSVVSVVIRDLHVFLINVAWEEPK
jgi:hypothetical protein